MKPKIDVERISTKGGDDLSAIHQEQSQGDALSTRDRRENKPMASYI